MKVKITEYNRSERFEALDAFLTPNYRTYDSPGQIEELEYRVGATAEALGKLLAHLVERRTISFEEAKDFVQTSMWAHEVELVNDDHEEDNDG